MTYLEQKRAQAQKIYQEEQKYWADHAEEFKKSVYDPHLEIVSQTDELWD